MAHASDLDLFRALLYAAGIGFDEDIDEDNNTIICIETASGQTDWIQTEFTFGQSGDLAEFDTWVEEDD